MLLALIMTFSILGSIGAIAGAALLLTLAEPVRARLVPALISYAVGTLLGAAFLGMLPVALAGASAADVLLTVLMGLVLFFGLEKLVLWRRGPSPDSRVGQAGPLILYGDALHNFVDGVVIAAAFLTSVPLGIATAIAVIAHEVPQELGDFAILLESGYSRGRALFLNTLSSATTIPGALAAYLWLEQTRALLPYVLAISAASFIYIAAADLIPSLHRRVSGGESVRQLLLLLAGVATVALLHRA